MTRQQNKLQVDVRTNPDRVGSVTASPLGSLIMKNTKKEYRNKMQRSRYVYLKAWQQLSGAAEPKGFVSTSMIKGDQREPVIKDFWSEITGQQILDVPFKLHPEIPNFGASPDGFLADNPSVLVECKHFEGNNMATMIETREIKFEHRVQMIAQIACYADRGARECEYIFANLDDKEGECITDFDDLHDHAIQSIRFKPTEEEIKSVLDEVEILVGEISEKFLILDHRSIPINFH